MKFKFGVDSFIWAEDFKEKDLWIIEKAKEIGFEVVDFAIANPYTFPTEQVKAELARVGMDCVCTTTLTLETNPISPDEEIRKAAVAAMKKCVDICNTLGAPILGGVNYAGWGYLTKKPRTDQEWDWGVACMREVAEYAKETGDEASSLRYESGQSIAKAVPFSRLCPSGWRWRFTRAQKSIR